MSIPIFDEPLTPEQVIEREKAFQEQQVINYEIAIDIRRQAYVKLSDPIYMQWQRGLKTEQDWLDAVAQVEKDYPVPVPKVSK